MLQPFLVLLKLYSHISLTVTFLHYPYCTLPLKDVTMLSYENSPHALGNTFASTAPAMDSTPNGHLSNGIPHKPEIKSQLQSERRHIWLITGPAGCGKSTVAEYIAKSLKLPFLEGDNVSLCMSLLNPPSN